MNRPVEQLAADFLSTDGVPAVGIRRAPELRRQRIVLACAQCGGRNYKKTKARREGSSLLSLSKFCNVCNAHTQHREAV